MLAPGGMLIVKDVRRGNPLKLAFTWILDALMARGGPVFYFDSTTMNERLDALHLHVLTPGINDWLP